MINELVMSITLFSLQLWHIINSLAGIDESVFSAKQCSFITGIEGPTLMVSIVSGLIVSMDRMHSIVRPNGQLHKVVKILAYLTPHIFSLIFSAITLGFCSVSRTSLILCTGAYLAFDPANIAKLGGLFSAVCVYSTAMLYVSMLLITFVKKKSIQRDENNVNSVSNIKSRRYEKLSKVLAFSAICNIPTTTMITAVFSITETRFGLLAILSYFKQGLVSVNGIITFASFYKFIPDFKKRLFGNNEETVVQQL
uniref:Vomeronasal type-1 receptor n=1 Tax=Romanomermis culicivorax TaxID=13658 RepID=A0A915IF10_ROMCU